MIELSEFLRKNGPPTLVADSLKLENGTLLVTAARKIEPNLKVEEIALARLSGKTLVYFRPKDAAERIRIVMPSILTFDRDTSTPDYVYTMIPPLYLTLKEKDVRIGVVNKEGKVTEVELPAVNCVAFRPSNDEE